MVAPDPAERAFWDVDQAQPCPSTAPMTHIAMGYFAIGPTEAAAIEQDISGPVPPDTEMLLRERIFSEYGDSGLALGAMAIVRDCDYHGRERVRATAFSRPSLQVRALDPNAEPKLDDNGLGSAKLLLSKGELTPVVYFPFVAGSTRPAEAQRVLAAPGMGPLFVAGRPYGIFEPMHPFRHRSARR